MKCDKNSLSTVASSERLFVQRREDPIVSTDAFSLRQLIELLVAVKQLLESGGLTNTSLRGKKTLSEGNELLDFGLDENSAANLEHLLLCLKHQLLSLLVVKLVEVVHKHVNECQRDQRKRRDDWFCQYPDVRHPLITTLPWNIRPSLAVLWGVCWMFYDHNGSHLPPPPPSPLQFDRNWNMVNERGEIIAESHAVVQYLSEIELERRRQQQQQQQQQFYAGERAWT